MAGSIPASSSLSVRRGFARRFRRNAAAMGGLAVVTLVALAAAIGPAAAPFGAWAIAGPPFLWPGEDPTHRLGTDVLGRDILSGLIHGARISLLIGIAATFAAVLVGATVGLLAGYFGGWLDDLLMRVTELFQTIPPFLFAVVIVAGFKPAVTTVIAAIAAVSWPGVARLVRGEALRLKNAEFVRSAVALGMGDARVILRHVLPNCLAPILVTGSLMVATAILTEAGLAFLTLSDPNTMSWGTMIAIGREALRSSWYMVALPGTAILVTVLAINLAGDGLNDALNPRLNQIA